MKKVIYFLLLVTSISTLRAQTYLYPDDTLVDPSLFSSSNILENWELGFCEIGTDSFAPCYKVTYLDHYVASIALCPENLDSVGGIGLFNGDPRLLDSVLFNDMEADGSNIISNADLHSINYKNLTTGTEIDGGGMNPKYCIEADLFEGDTVQWYQKFEILLGPIFKGGAPDPYHIAEKIGVLKNGILLEHTPPSSESMVALFGGIIPLDRCGWHPEPAGFGHFHAVPTGINMPLDAIGVDPQYQCMDIDQENNSGLAGFSFEGIPIYGPLEDGGTSPTMLDGCNGHTHPTLDFPEGAYHYHTSETDVINNPPCSKAYTPINNFDYGEWMGGEAPEAPGAITGLDTVCPNQPNVSYSISAVTGATSYNWSVPNDATIVSGDGTTSITVNFGANVDSICVNAENALGTSANSCLSLAAAACNKPPKRPGAITGLDTVCLDQTGVSYTIDDVTGANYYIWKVPMGATIVSGDSTASIIVDFTTAVGDICVSAGNTFGVSDSSCIAIQETICGTPPDTPGAITGLDIVCPNQTGVTYTISEVTGAIYYNWSVPTGATITGGAGTTSITVSFGQVIDDICVNAQNIAGTGSDRCLSIQSCAPTSIHVLSNDKNRLSAYPLLVSSGSITLRGAHDSYVIFDLHGKEVKRSDQASSGTETVIDLSTIPSGVYFMRARKSNTVLFEKIVVENN